MRYLYLLSIVVSFAGIVTLDWRYRLALFWRWRTALRLMLLGFVFFVVWDVALVGSGLYWTMPQYVSGWYIGTPDLPIEEIGFLLFLNYLTLVLWRWRWARIS